MKKTGLEKSTHKIGGISGKGAYTYNEVGSGEKCLSSSRGKLTSDRGKMNSAHGTNGQSTDNNMNQNRKGAIGAYCRTFAKGIPHEAPSPIPHVGHVTKQGREKD